MSTSDFLAFCESRRFVESIGDAIKDEALQGVPGLVYLGAYFIEVVWNSERERYSVVIGNSERDSDSLIELEGELYRFYAGET